MKCGGIPNALDDPKLSVQTRRFSILQRKMNANAQASGPVTNEYPCLFFHLDFP